MPTFAPLLAALVVATIAAVSDLRTGRISNWITLPVVFVSPVLYSLFSGPRQGAVSAASLLMCGFVPYALFRRRAMGGGDVKLFAALGAVTGFDLRVGLEIEFFALAVACGIAILALLRKGSLRAMWRRTRVTAVRLFDRSRTNELLEFESLTPIRLGVPVLVATVLVASPMLLASWSSE